jgi:hypothetical protein
MTHSDGSVRPVRVAWGVMPDSEETPILIQLPRAIANEGRAMVFLSKGEPFVVQELADRLASLINDGAPWLRTTVAGVHYTTFIRSSEVVAITALDPAGS